jgi:hypothetical protein
MKLNVILAMFLGIAATIHVVKEKYETDEEGNVY